jgi:hypothetical protein
MQRDTRKSVQVKAERRECGGWKAWAEAWPLVWALATTYADAEAEVQRELERLGLVRRVAA